MVNLPAEPPIAENGSDVGVAGQTPIAVLLPSETRTFVPQHLIGGVGILDEVVAAGVEVDACFGRVQAHGFNLSRVCATSPTHTG